MSSKLKISMEQYNSDVRPKIEEYELHHESDVKIAIE